MRTQSVIAHGVLAGMLWLVSAHAVHWFLTPHPDAGGIRQILVAVQLVLGVAIGYWVYRRGSKMEQELVRR